MVKGVVKSGIIPILALAAICLRVAGGEPRYTQLGKVLSLDRSASLLTLQCQNGKVRLSFLAPGIVRVHMAPQGHEFPADTLHLAENGPYAVVTHDWPGVTPDVADQFDPDLEGKIYRISAWVRFAQRQEFSVALHRHLVLRYERESAPAL